MKEAGIEITSVWFTHTLIYLPRLDRLCLSFLQKCHKKPFSDRQKVPGKQEQMWDIIDLEALDLAQNLSNH